MPDPDPIPLSLVLTTEADRERAEALAMALLQRGLVACASLYPVVSLYRWQGQLERSEEIQLLLKTRPGNLEALRRALGELHSYDTPEWIHWPASSDGPYGRWLLEPLPLSPGGGPPAPAGRPGGGDPAG
jgi:periplasmic divalent cation tolerance protein